LNSITEQEYEDLSSMIGGLQQKIIRPIESPGDGK